jgi:two-component system, LytTR family, sensor kinase
LAIARLGRRRPAGVRGLHASPVFSRRAVSAPSGEALEDPPPALPGVAGLLCRRTIVGALLRSLLIPKTEDDWFPSPFQWFLTSLPFGFAVYFAVLATEHAFRFLLESRQSETQAARLAAQLAEARLGALRMQLNPHFLFNSLNTILVMVRDGDKLGAAASIERLAGVLRRILKVDQEHEIALGDAIEFLEQYLAIEETRFSDRLRPRFDVAPSLRNAAVPELILQPLVENALRHGIGKRTESGLLTISARRDGDDLVLVVEDDGAGLPAAGVREGVGLSNVSIARLWFALTGCASCAPTPTVTSQSCSPTAHTCP